MRTALGKASPPTPDQGIEIRHDMITGKRDTVADASLLQRLHQNIRPALFHAFFHLMRAASHGLDRLSSRLTLDFMEQLKVSVWRDAEAGGFARYDVPARDNQTVLDVVTHIQRELDPSLAYRFACRVGMCGSCAMTVNGRARWTCRTHVRKVAGADGALELRPLANLPVIRDLAADLAPFFDKWQRAQGFFQPKDAPDGAVPDEFAVVAPGSKARQEADAGIECIGCAVCYASCDVVTWNQDYLGPAALNRAWTLVNDARDGARGERLDAVAGDAGCHSCHSTRSCTERCPKQIDPSGAIAGLKRTLFWDSLFGGKRHG